MNLFFFFSNFPWSSAMETLGPRFYMFYHLGVESFLRLSAELPLPTHTWHVPRQLLSLVGKDYTSLPWTHESSHNVFCFTFRLPKDIYVDTWFFHNTPTPTKTITVSKSFINVVLKFFHNGNLNFPLVPKALYHNIWC